QRLGVQLYGSTLNSHGGVSAIPGRRLMTLRTIVGRRLRRHGFGHLLGHLAANRAYLAFQIAHACLAGVLADEEADSAVSELDMGGREAMLLDLARHQELLGNVVLLIFYIARQIDH